MAITAEHVEELTRKLLSDRQKEREAGLRDLKSYLNIKEFCSLLDEQTEEIPRQGPIPSSTWPGVVHALCESIAAYLKTPKKKGPNIEYAKTLKNLVKKACSSDKRLLLIRKVRYLYQHLAAVICSVPSFESDYCSIVLVLLNEVEYRLCMSKKIYGELVDFLVSKRTSAANNESTGALLSLIKHPPGDLPDTLRPAIITSLSEVFLHISDSKNLLRKLLESVTGLLRHDGPNLGESLSEIHSSARKCLIRAWPTLNDDSHKELFLLYLRMQLKLRVIIVDDQGGNLQEMLELVEKELDGMAWDTKAVSLARPLLSLLRLAASVIYEVLRKGSSYTGHNVKRRRKENMDAVLKDRVKDAKSLWVGAVCLLIKHYGPKIPTELLYDLLNGLVSSLERLSTDAINSGTFEAPLWTVRCLNEACDMVDATCHGGKLWQSIWHAMVRWILLMSAIPQLVEEALKLLGCLAMKNLVLVYTIPNEFWDLHLFKELPTRNALFFVAAFFSTYGCQLEDLELRKTLLCWCSTALNLEAKHNAEGRIPPKILTGAFLALSIGSTGCTMTEIADALWSWSEPEEQDRIQEAELAALDHAEEVLAACGIPDELKANTLCKRMSLIGLASSDSLLQVLADNLLQTIQAVQESKDQRLEVLLHLCTVISYCLHEVGFSRQKRGQRLNIWSHDGNVCKGLGVLVQCCVALLEEIGSIADTRKQLTDKAVRALHEFVLVPNVHASADAEGVNGGFTSSLETLMKAILQRLCSIPEVDGSIVMSPASTEASCLQRIMDAELDIEEAHTHMETKCGSHGNWKSICISMISVLGEVLPESAFHALQKALPAEQDPKVREEILLSMCKVFRASVLVAELPLMVDLMRGSLEKGQHSEAGCHQTLTAAQLILSELNSEKARTKSKLPVQPQVLSELLKVIEDVAKVRILQWPTRSKLGEVTSSFLLLDPELAQGLTHIFLELLHDPDFRVRISHSSRISVLFETWNGHHGLLQDVCLNLGVKMPMATRFEVISAAEACQSGGSIKDTWTKTALVTIGEVAAASEKVEIEAVFMILAQSALQPTQRMLAAAIISRLAKRLGYPDGWKFLEQLIRGIFSRWVVTAMPLPGLMEIREILVRRADLSNFLHHCTPFLLPHLLLHGRDAELHWLAQATSTSVKSMVKEHFASTFAALLPLHCDSNAMEMDRVSAVLQGSMLASSGLTGGERDDLIKKLMVSIIIHIFQLVSAEDNPEMPYFSKDAAITGVKTAVDGLFEEYVDSLQLLVTELIPEAMFMHSNRTSQDRTIVDKLQIFRADRVFQILLQIHDQAASSCHSRHRRHSLIRLETLIEIIDNKVLVPSTFRYLIHIILQSTEMVELQGQCCSLISQIIKKLENPSSSWILGEQLQSLVSRLVSCSISSYGTAEQKRLGRDMHGPAPAVIDLLHRLTAGADANLHQYIKELDPFPDIPCFEPIRKLQLELRSTSTFPAEFVKFVRRAPFLPSQLRLWSLQSFCNQLRERREELRSGTGKQARDHWFCSDDVVIAVWELVLLCNEEDDNDIRNLTAEFLAAAGIGDPDAVVFHLPDASKNFLLPSSRSRNNEIISIDPETGISEDIARVVLTQLCNCLLDKDVSVIDLASKTVKGLLSTEKGYRVLGKLNTHDKAYLEVHTKGVNLKLVEDMLTVNRLESSNKAVPIEDSSLWSTSGKTYDVWISTLVHSLIEFTEDSFLRLCQGLILVKATLAELLLPHVLGCLAGKLQTSSKLYSEVVAQVQRHIFSDSNKNTRSIQVFLEALNGLRVCHVNAARNAPSKRQGNVKVAQGLLEWPKVYWMDVDYLLTAKAAQKCAAYFTSVLYVEHWCEEKFGRLTLGDPQLCDDNQLSEHLELLLAVYTKANEPDGVYGIVRAHKPVSQVRLYEHEGNWGKALETYDLLLRSSSVHPPEAKTPYYKGVVKALQQIGCSRVNEMYCTGLAKSNLELTNDMEFRELQYETAWRSGKWDLNVVDLSPVAVNVDGTLDLGFHGKLHSSFKCLMEGDSDKFQSHVKQMKEELISHVVHTSLESTQNVHPAIVKLQVVDSLSQAWDLRWPSSGSFRPAIPPNNQMRTFLTSWKQMFKQTRENYNLLEPFGSFLKVLFKVLERDDHLPSQLVQHAVLARKAGRLNHAAVAIQELKDFCNKRVEDEGAQSFLRAGRIEEAKVLWAQGQQEMAVTLLKYLLSQIEHTANATALYCLAGKWLAETRSASSRVIMESYFQKSVEMAESACISNPHNKEFIRRKCKTHFHLAHFANALYQSYEDRLHSNEWQAALRLRNHKAKEFDALLKKLKETQGDKRDYSIKAAELQKQLKMDVDEESRLHADRAHFLHVSLVNYRSCLLTSDKYDIRVVFRLVSLWFDLSTDQKVVADMLLSVQKVQSFKFLPLVYQIASRMGPSKSSNDFQFVVNLLVRKMAIEHPYHSLYQLLALANGDRIKDNQKRKQAFVIDLDKKHAAEELLNQLSAHHHSELILQVKRMVEIYIKLAELEVKKGDPSNKIPIPRDIRSVRQLEQVPVITANVAVDRSCKYPDQSFPYFKGFVDQITIMNGINAPKVVDCLGSDGRKYRQLAKSGDDDLRQDAVMEQLFGLVNTLLKHHPETRKRCLQVRTYKVIPFTPSAGALEWVDGTIPLGEYLLGSTREGGAHSRYGSGDWPFMKCRQHMTSEENKSAAFQTVYKNFRPVMRFFFRENFKQAADWFEKRLTYTRSVAASSMVGYIIGLGDRHAMNILIDQASAEVVHIDLGVAFEQGLMLKTPERIPFRLTRDIVDGMGVSGVEGVFRRCCEATLSVMRANKEALLTIVEVFIHDPLYKWALSPLKALQKQKEVEGLDEEFAGLDRSEVDVEGNKDAARALLRVKQKLDGYEDGEMRTVQGQVQQLIQDAQDPERLCQLFPGWGAWL